jgi:beta-xylosidase
VIFPGTPLGLTEAPHLYKRDGYYYLLTAEGGTGWNHAVTMARSRDLTGPYELHPDTYILSSRDRPDAPLQRAGHADLVETPTANLDGLSLRPPPPQSRPLRAGPRDRDPADGWGEDGWLYTTWTAPASRAGDAGARPARIPGRAAPARAASTAPSCRSTSNGCARRSRRRSSA